MKVEGIELHRCVVALGFTLYCDHIVTVFFLVLFVRHAATELDILRRRNLNLSAHAHRAVPITHD